MEASKGTFIHLTVFVAGNKTLLWSSLPRAEMDLDFVFSNTIRHETMCR